MMQMEHPSRAAGAQGCVFCVQSVLGGCVCSSPGNKTLGNGSIVCSGSVLSPHSLVPFFLTPRGNQTPPAQSQPRFPTCIPSLGSAGQKLPHVPPWCVNISCSSWTEGLLLQWQPQGTPALGTTGQQLSQTPIFSTQICVNGRAAACCWDF